MHATTVAVDLTKSVFQLAVADEQWHVVETQRLTRTRFERWFANRDVSLIIWHLAVSTHTKPTENRFEGEPAKSAVMERRSNRTGESPIYGPYF